jgi:hypothetical protein
MLSMPSLSAEPAHPHVHHEASVSLSHSGQATFAALAEVVAVLEADPTTDWTKVDLTRLREHLVDMDDVLVRAAARMEETKDAVLLRYRGTGRTLEAIRRMIPAHARMMNGHRGWQSTIEIDQDGVTWTLSTESDRERARIRALGPFGLLTLGSHHGPHHLAMARGTLRPH